MRIVITGIGVVSPFGVGRERFWEQCARRLQRDARDRTEFDASASSAALPRRGARAERDARRCAGARRRRHRRDPRTTARIRSATRGRRSSASSRRAKRGPMPACASASRTPASSSAAAAAASTSANASTTTSSSSSGKQGHAVRHSRSRSSAWCRARSRSRCGCAASAMCCRAAAPARPTRIGYAAALIRSGEADVILSGGTDACVTPGMMFGFSRMHVVSTAYNDRPAEASRPFDKGRDGFVLGEGAWMLVLEREDRARARGAKVYASIDGYGSTCDAYHRVQMAPDGEEIVRAIDARDRAVGPAARGDRLHQLPRHVHAAERRRRVAVRAQVFGDRADRLAGSSVKSMIGHPQGASGAAGIVTAALASIAASCRPPSTSRDPDPACDLDFIPNHGAPGVDRGRAVQLPRVRIEEQRARDQPGAPVIGTEGPRGDVVTA